MDNPVYTTLIDAASLSGLLAQHAAGAADVAVFDLSFDLANPGAGVDQFEAVHVASAVHLHLDDDLSGPKAGALAQANACGGRHPLPSRDLLAERLSAWGVGPRTQVVAYDRSVAPFTGMFAVRLWGLLRWAGHSAVAVLDGGFTAWQAFGGAVESGPGVPRSAKAFMLQPSRLAIRSANDVQTRIGRPEARLVDARLADRFSGAVEPMDPVAGHIPGALNRFFGQNITASGPDGGHFKPAAVLREEFGDLLGGTSPADVTHQCGSGVTALHNLLAMEVAGLGGSALYAGSWSEWCADPARPIARSA